jgi:hypothetical protein
VVDTDTSASATKLDSTSRNSVIIHDDSPTGSPSRRDTKNHNNFWPMRLANRRKNNKRQNSTCISEHAFKYQQSQENLERAARGQLAGAADLYSISSSNFLSVVRDNSGSQSNLLLHGVKDNDQGSIRSRRSSSTSLKTLVNIKMKISNCHKSTKIEPIFDGW